MEIRLEHIRKSYRRKPVLSDICLSAQGGQCIGILGANGSGKSTLLSILAGILPRDEGSFLVNGRDLFTQPRRRSQLVGYVPQGVALMEELTARDNLRLWYSRKDLARELETGVLSLLGIGEFLDKPVYKLSGGMKKRLSIGCAVAGRPPILLLDEPTAALDLACKQQIDGYLRSYRAAGGLLFLTTHDPAELALCDTLYILKNGVLEPYTFDGNVEELVRRL